MKYTRKCLNCGSTEIYRVEAVVGNGYGSGNVIPTGLLGTIKVNRYVCGNCGKCSIDRGQGFGYAEKEVPKNLTHSANGRRILEKLNCLFSIKSTKNLSNNTNANQIY